LFYSPLRYPGGKGKLEPLIELLIVKTGHIGGTYIEPFAGGAAIAIELLLKGTVNRIVINDLDKGIYSFWRAILTETERFINKIDSVPLNMTQWQKEREICVTNNKKYSFDLGFATFYMNRTNRSGIIKGGVIGGLEQSGTWKLDARFNRENLIKRILAISERKNDITVYNKDIKSFLTKYVQKYEGNTFIYFDPPYFEKGKQLYLNFFDKEDHIEIEKTIMKYAKCDWVISYDDVPEIIKIYKNRPIRKFDLTYSASKMRIASEVAVFKNLKMIPNSEELKENNLNINMRIWGL